jgi:heavy metal translocating P-type ATPase
MRRRSRHAHCRRQPKSCCPPTDCCKPAGDERRPIKVPAVPTGKRDDDVEKGAGERNKLVISIKGMDCGSCFTRVSRALQPIPTVKVESTDLMAGRATLTYDTAFTDGERIVSTILEQSGFVCHIVFDGKSGERVLRVRSNQVIRERDAMERVKGITRVRHEGKEVYSIVFDPACARGRDVLTSLASWNVTFVPPPGPMDEGGSNELRPLVIRTLISALLSVPVLIFAWAPLPEHPVLYGALSIAFTTPIQWGCAYYIHAGALRVLVKQRSLEMDFLVTLSTTTAYVYSVIAYGLQVAGVHISEGFFEASALLVTLILIGRLVSAWSRRRATSALNALQGLVPDTALVVAPDGGATEIPASLVEAGDIMRVSPHARVTLDGTIIAGESDADESSLTGESMLVHKKVGDKVFAGTLNVSGPLDVRVVGTVGENTISNIAVLMQEAQASRVPLQDSADRMASLLTPAALAAAFGAFIAWTFCGIVVQRFGSSSVPRAITYAIAVLVVSCPCALGLAVPLVFVIATTLAGKNGVLIKDAAVLQNAQSIDTVVFDKTGTLTLGKLRVVDVWIDPESRNVNTTVFALTKDDKHPVAVSVAESMKAELAPNGKLLRQVPKPKSVVSIPGRGLEALLPDGSVLRGGSPIWLNVANDIYVAKLTRAARTVFCVTRNDRLIAVFGLADELRPGMREGLRALLRRRLDVHIVSGDNSAVVRATAAELHLPASCTVLGDRSVKEKAAHIRALQRAGRRVLFCGDGTNDGPALAQADIGVSLASGTDLATSAAHIVLMAPQPDIPKSVTALIRLSSASMARVRLNFVWCIVYNICAIALAGGLFVKIRVPPAYAGLGELVSVLPVVLIAFTMYWYRFK